MSLLDEAFKTEARGCLLPVQHDPTAGGEHRLRQRVVLLPRELGRRTSLRGGNRRLVARSRQVKMNWPQWGPREADGVRMSLEPADGSRQVRLGWRRRGPIAVQVPPPYCVALSGGDSMRHISLGIEAAPRNAHHWSATRSRDPKNDKPRYVDVGPEVVSVLRAVKAEQAALRLAAGES